MLPNCAWGMARMRYQTARPYGRGPLHSASIPEQLTPAIGPHPSGLGQLWSLWSRLHCDAETTPEVPPLYWEALILTQFSGRTLFCSSCMSFPPAINL